MRELQLSARIGEVTGQLFGNRMGDEEPNESLLASDSPENFDAMFEQLVEVWSGWENGERFTAYMNGTKDAMKSKMSVYSRIAGGLGNPPIRFTTNPSEAINRKLHQRQNNQEAGLTSFIRSISDLLRKDREEIHQAYIGTSKLYHIHSIFTGLLGNRFDITTMTPEQRLRYIRTLSSTSMSELHTKVTSLPVAQLAYNRLSVQPRDAKIKVPRFLIEQMWGKAQCLLETPLSIIQAPSTTSDVVKYAVISKSRVRNNEVSVRFANRQVDCTCPGYRIHSIFAHAVAVGEENCVLADFLEWHRKATGGTNLTSAAYTRVDIRRVGMKGKSPRRTRKRT